MSFTLAASADAPMGDLNTTPLIDVMLVLLVMFIVTIPLQTHAVKVDLPPPAFDETPQPDPLVNALTVDRTGSVGGTGRRSIWRRCDSISTARAP